MSLLSNIKADDSIAGERDSVGTGGIVESGLYPSKISLAYLSQAASGAVALNVVAKTESGRDLKATVYMTSGKEKGGTNTYKDKEGATQFLPGYLLATSLALLTVGKEIGDLATEQKVISLYSYDAKAEVPTKVEMLVDLLGQDIIIGVIKQTVDKNVKDGAGKYVPSGETREENEFDKFFRARDRMTTTEIRGQVEKATFIDTWDAKWTGKDRNKAKGASGTAGAPKAAGVAAGAKAKPVSLFS